MPLPKVEKIVMDNLDYLFRFAYFKICNRDAAEDIVYDAILKFLEKDLTDVDEKKLRMYLYRIVYNCCLDYLNKDNWLERFLHSPREPYDFIQHIEEEIIEKEEVERIYAILDTLHDKESEVIRMNVIENLSFVDIADILDTPVTTIKSRFKTGMDKLRKQYFK